MLALMEEQNESHVATELWRDVEQELADAVRSGLPWDLFRKPLLQATMLSRGWRRQAAELRLVRTAYPADRLHALLQEDPAGCPTPAVLARWTSPTAIHHLAHLTRFRKATGADPFSLGYVVEWGGGYGQLARMLRRGGTEPPTHVIVDMPAVAAMQWTWLATVVGAEAVHVPGPGAEPRAGRINLMTPSAYARAGARAPGALISTWGLSEAPASVQDLAAGSLRDATHLLVAAQRHSRKFPASGRLLRSAARSGALLTAVPGRRGSLYALR